MNFYIIITKSWCHEQYFPYFSTLVYLRALKNGYIFDNLVPHSEWDLPGTSMQ